MTAEDGVADTLSARLATLGADRSRVLSLQGWEIANENPKRKREGVLTLQDLPVLEKALAKAKPVLLVVDPIQAFLGPGVDMSKAEQVRPILAGLARLAERHGCAALAIQHLTKATTSHAIFRGLGSIDLVGAARSVLLAGADPATKERALVQIKTLSPKRLQRSATKSPATVASSGRARRNSRPATSSRPKLRPPTVAPSRPRESCSRTWSRVAPPSRMRSMPRPSAPGSRRARLAGRRKAWGSCPTARAARASTAARALARLHASRSHPRARRQGPARPLQGSHPWHRWQVEPLNISRGATNAFQETNQETTESLEGVQEHHGALNWSLDK